MNATEKFYIDSYRACAEEDDYNNGIQLHGSTSSWTERECAVEGDFDTAEDALRAFCDQHGFTFRKEDWENDPISDADYGRFDTDIEVDENNAEATDNEIDEWKAGKRKLWCCHISIHLSVRSIRNLTETEAKAA